MSRLVPRVVLATLWLSLPGLLVACSDDDPTALPPGDGTGAKNGGKPAPIPRRDSGTPNGDPDSGLDEDSGMGAGGTTAPAPAMPSECKNIGPARFIGEDPSVEVVASSALPLDFEITRVVATWETDCKMPTIRVDLSDGSCPNGRGHLLSFSFQAGAIDSGAIFPGLYTVFPEPVVGDAPVKIRYTRPGRLMPPEGIWGSCASSTGTLNFTGEPSTKQFSDLQVSRFDLELTPCDGRANEVMTIQGSFKVELQRGLREACP